MPSTGETDAPGPAPFAGKLHECCQGLAHAPLLAEAPTAFLVVAPPAIVADLPATVDAFTPVGIRDGPGQPRAPPFLA